MLKQKVTCEVCGESLEYLFEEVKDAYEKLTEAGWRIEITGEGWPGFFCPGCQADKIISSWPEWKRDLSREVNRISTDSIGYK